MKISSLIFFISFFIFAVDREPIQIISKMQDKINFSSMKATFNIKTVDKKGSSKNLNFKTKIYNTEDANYQMIWFLNPANFKGISFLRIQIENSINMKMWYPKYKKIRMIPSSNLSDSFMNSELIYQDMVIRYINEYDYKIINEEIYNDNVCYVIESIPKENISTYGKHRTWISKKDYLPLMEISYSKEMRPIKKKINYYNENFKIDSLIVKNINTQSISSIRIIESNTDEEFNINDFNEINLKRLPR